MRPKTESSRAGLEEGTNTAVAGALRRCGFRVSRFCEGIVLSPTLSSYLSTGPNPPSPIPLPGDRLLVGPRILVPVPQHQPAACLPRLGHRALSLAPTPSAPALWARSPRAPGPALRAGLSTHSPWTLLCRPHTSAPAAALPRGSGRAGLARAAEGRRQRPADRRLPHSPQRRAPADKGRRPARQRCAEPELLLLDYGSRGTPRAPGLNAAGRTTTPGGLRARPGLGSRSSRSAVGNVVRLRVRRSGSASLRPDPRAEAPTCVRVKSRTVRAARRQ